MEDVVLHYQSGSVEELSSLFQRTEKLLECFPCRPPPLFTPWFPSDHRPPIRPAKPAPVITCAGDSLVSDSRLQCTGFVSKKHHNHPTSETTGSPPENSQRGNGVLCISETPNHLQPERRVTGLSPQKLPPEDRHGVPVPDRHGVPVTDRHGVPVPDRHGVPVTDRHGVPVPDRHGVPVPDRHGVPVTDRHGVPVTDRHGVPVPDRHGVPVPDRHGVPVPDRHGVPVTDRHGVPVTDRHGVPVTDRHGVPVPDRHGVPVPDRHGVPVTDRHGVPVTDRHGVPVTDRHGVPVTDRHGVPVPDAAVKRSWSVFTRRGVFPQSCHSLSKQFDHMVSVHRLHLRQRAKWVIRGDNCGSARDIEQVWRTLSRCVRRGELPTCNANIQRDLVEIWVFCDVLCSEQVGRFLKAELQLSGRILLSVHQRGNVFSL